MIKVAFTLFSLIAAAFLTGCQSYDPAVRRQKLLEIYPPGQTTRAEVQAKWSPINPDVSATRPVEGWSACVNDNIRRHTFAAEMRSGQMIHRTERYLGVDGLGLCWCWFYYNELDTLVDAECQFHSD